MTPDILILIIYLFLWTILIIYVLKKYGFKRLGSIYLLFYAAISFVAFDLYMLSLGSSTYEGLNLLPLIYLILFLYLFSRPLLLLNQEKLELLHPSSKTINIVSIIIILFSLISIQEVFLNFTTGLVQMIIDDSAGAAMYRELRNGSQFDSKSSSIGLGNLVGVISGVFRGTASLFCLYYLSRNDKNILITTGLFISMVVNILFGIASGSRFFSITTLMNIIGFSLFMFPYYSKRIKYVYSVIGIALISIVFLGSFLITISRNMEGNLTGRESLEVYTSSSILHFSKYAFEPGQYRNGDRTFPLIKRVFTADITRGYTDRISKYRYMKINESQFITFIGDFLLDFGGVWGSLIMLLIIAIISRILNRKKSIGVEHLVIVYFLVVILNGFYLYQFPDFGGNLQFIFLFFLYGFFKYTKHYKQV